MTLPFEAEAFFVARKADGVTAKTLLWHRTSLATFYGYLEAYGHPLDCESWTPTLLRSYVVHLQNQDYKPSTVATKVQSLLAFTRWLPEEEFTEKNVGARIKKPKVPQKHKEVFTDEELHRLLRHCSTLRDYAVLCLLIDCGLRATELATLKVENVLLGQNMLLVHGKGQKDRVIPFSPQTAKAVRRYLSKEHSGSEYLIESKSKSCLSANSLLQVVIRIGKAAGIENVHPHKFRHTFATSYLRNGGDPLTLQKLLGHTTLAMTNHYVAMNADDLSKRHLLASPLAHLLKKGRTSSLRA